jgi:hypothetical protein
MDEHKAPGLTAEERAIAVIFGTGSFMPMRGWEKEDWSVYGHELVEALEAAEIRGRQLEWDYQLNAGNLRSVYVRTPKKKSPAQQWEDKWLGVDQDD